MVSEKRLDYGFNGYQVPPMPRARRSSRRSSLTKKNQDNQSCAFDLLATLAGKVLLEGESFPTTEKGQCDIYEDAAEKQPKDEENLGKVEFHDQRSYKTNSLCSELASHAHNQNYNLKECICTDSNTFSGITSLIASNCSERIGCGEKLVIGKSKSEEHAKVDSLNIGKALGISAVDPCSEGDSAVLNGKSPALICSDSSSEVPSHRDCIPCGSFPAWQEEIDLGIRDDDENSSRCIQPSTARKTLRQTSHTVDRRVRKLLASKYWKVDSIKRKGVLSSIDGEMKAVYLNRKVCYKCQRSQRIYPFKKRKLYDWCSASKSVGRVSGGSIFNLSRKGTHQNPFGSHAAKLGGLSLILTPRLYSYFPPF